jgi:hypothetical protein
MEQQGGFRVIRDVRWLRAVWMALRVPVGGYSGDIGNDGEAKKICQLSGQKLL